LRACYVARHCAVYGTADGKVLRGQVWDARRRFVSLLQDAMGQSMVRGAVDSAGQHIAKDPTTWTPPIRVIGLPIAKQVRGAETSTPRGAAQARAKRPSAPPARA
jgi:hypothetical protein